MAEFTTVLATQFASQAEAEAGSNNTKVMTPLRAAQAIAALAGGGLTEDRIKSLTFTAAPASMEFGILIGAGTDEVVLNGAMNAAAIQAALEASDDLAGYTVDVKGSSTAGSALPDGVLPYTGTFYVYLTGSEPYPEWAAVENAEVQSFVVEAGDGGNYTLNGGANFTMGVTEADLQTNQRALGGDYAAVVVKGSSAAGSGGGGNELTGGTATANGDNGADVPSKCVDGNTGTFWSSNNGAPSWWKYDFGLGNSETLVELDMTAKSDEGSAMPAAFKVQGSNVASPNDADPHADWTDLSSQSGLSWSNGETKNFTWSNSTAYRHYRISAPAAGFVKIAEISMESAATAASATFRSYFPRSAGTVAAPSSTGTDDVVATVYEGDSASALVVADAASLDELVWSGVA